MEKFGTKQLVNFSSQPQNIKICVYKKDYLNK